MTIGFAPVAEASIGTLVSNIDRVIINPIIFLLFAIALAIFLYGIARYLLNPDSEEIRKSSKSSMIWGVVGLFIMVAVFGIMRIILNTVQEKRIKINDTGQIQINK